MEGRKEGESIGPTNDKLNSRMRMISTHDYVVRWCGDIAAMDALSRQLGFKTCPLGSTSFFLVRSDTDVDVDADV